MSTDPTAALTPAIPLLAVQQRWESAAAELQVALDQELVLAFIGAASAGKDAAIRAIFGVDFGEVSPIPGSTAELKAIRLDGPGNTVVVNAPGFGDLRPEVEQATRAFLSRVDLAVYVVNSDGGATIDDRRNIETMRGLKRPLLVVLNKIDLIRPNQRAGFVDATTRQLGVEPKDVVVAAFDPLPALEDEPVGIQEVVMWICDRLAGGGKDLLFAKQLRNKAAAAELVIRVAAKRAAIGGAIPIPGADLAAVTAVHVKLISDLAAIYDVRMDQQVVMFILGEALAGAGKGFVRWGMEALKAAGWLPGGQLGELAASAIGASVASAATWGVGKATVVWLEQHAQGRQMSGEALREVFDKEAFSYKDRDKVGSTS
jgi:GTP-binding protein Era